jgi:hypothetical protein
MKYRKKPVEIEAIQYLGDDVAAAEFVGDAFDVTVTETGIQTLEGFMRISHGDFIIKGIQGEFYPCKPDIFEQTYEPVDSGGTAELQADRATLEAENARLREALLSAKPVYASEQSAAVCKGFALSGELKHYVIQPHTVHTALEGGEASSDE